MRCPKCGEEIYEGDSFCTACGMRVVKPSRSGSSTSKVLETPRPVNITAVKNRNLLIGLVFAAVVAAAIFFVVRGKGDNLTGTWQAVKEPDSYIELYDTGYGVACGLWNGSQENMKWTFENNTLTMIPEDTLQYSTVTVEIRLKGDTMTMMNSSGNALEFERINK